jgi:hypothetical protein
MGKKEKIELEPTDGAIVIRNNLEPEIYAPTDHGEIYDSVRFTLAFIMYAVEQEDWVVQFSDFVDSIEDRIEEKKDRKAISRRSKFEVIDGDKK